MAVTVEEGLPELLSKAREETRSAHAQHKRCRTHAPLTQIDPCASPTLQVDTFQSDVAAITADLRKPLGGGQGGQAAAGLVARGFETGQAPAGAVTRPASRVRGGAAARTAVKPSASWRLGDVAPLAVGEPLDDGACTQEAF